MKRIGVADTTFARVDMGAAAIDELKKTALQEGLTVQIGG